MRTQAVSVWFCSIAAAVLGDVVYRRSQTNSTIKFSCHYPANMSKDPFSFRLNRSVPNKQIVYYNLDHSPHIEEEWKYRLIVNKNTNVIDLTMLSLQIDDSDLYHCLFTYNMPSTFLDHKAETVALFVEDIKPHCSEDHKVLLYALSGATGLLFITVFTLSVAYCSNPGGKKKSNRQFTVPIYEEMNGMRDKDPLSVQENDFLSTYAQPKKENPYIN